MQLCLHFNLGANVDTIFLLGTHVFLFVWLCVHILWWFPVFYQVVDGTNSALVL